jgi:hypothetical protein
MPGLAFILCMVTSVVSALLLWRAARGPTRRLLLWSAAFFIGMAVNNLLLFIDVVTGPQVDWLTPANIVMALSLAGLIYALIWESTWEMRLSMLEFNAFLRGFIAMGYLVTGLFFLRFYSRTRDRLFLLFCVAFWLLGVLRAAMLLVVDPLEQDYLYWLRLVAYLLILAAIIDKNRSKQILPSG